MFKKDYFIDRAEEFGVCIIEYLIDAEFNYVIIENGKPWLFNDMTPLVYGGEEDAMAQLADGDYDVITELEFIMYYCRHEFRKVIAKAIVAEGMTDDVCYIHPLDNSFDKVINLNGCTDILALYVPMDSQDIPSVLCATDDDKVQLWYDFLDLDEWLNFKILCDLV